MNYDEFTIVIKKNGEIVVRIEGMEDRKVRHYREIFEDTIGPVKEIIEASDDAPPGGVRYSDHKKSGEEDKDKNKLQH